MKHTIFFIVLVLIMAPLCGMQEVKTLEEAQQFEDKFVLFRFSCSSSWDEGYPKLCNDSRLRAGFIEKGIKKSDNGSYYLLRRLKEAPIFINTGIEFNGAFLRNVSPVKMKVANPAEQLEILKLIINDKYAFEGNITLQFYWKKCLHLDE